MAFAGVVVVRWLGLDRDGVDAQVIAVVGVREVSMGVGRAGATSSAMLRRAVNLTILALTYGCLTDAYEPLSKIIPISKNKLTPYRAVIIMRLVVLGLFFHYRITNPVDSAFGLWLTSVICEILFGFSWILDQFPKWCPVNRETYVDRLIARYGDGEDSGLAPVDFFVTTVDPLKEPPLITANTVLSILAVDYPVEKVSCYVSDDGASMLTFESLAETAEFARRWVPFCKMYAIEPRTPEFYFSQKIDYLKDKIHPSYVKERGSMKRDYEEYKVRINALVAKAQKTPEEGCSCRMGHSGLGTTPVTTLA
ncbi:hypothetical protein ACQ4PT_024251 [Festuca glaucescens]